jgi:hypothetical protein
MQWGQGIDYPAESAPQSPDEGGVVLYTFDPVGTPVHAHHQVLKGSPELSPPG